MKKSVYFQFEDVEIFDKTRDANTFDLKTAVVAHPPCRAWGKYKNRAKPELGEKELALLALEIVRKNGGVLEHPKGSSLWKECNLPTGKTVDEFGGFTISVNQSWFGHRAEKQTLLYIVGVKPSEIPPYPIKFDLITHNIASSNKKGSKKPEVTRREREATPILFAKWLIDLAELCKKQHPC